MGKHEVIDLEPVEVQEQPVEPTPQDVTLYPCGINNGTNPVVYATHVVFAERLNELWLTLTQWHDSSGQNSDELIAAYERFVASPTEIVEGSN